jgi:hypothetical protein
MLAQANMDHMHRRADQLQTARDAGAAALHSLAEVFAAGDLHDLPPCPFSDAMMAAEWRGGFRDAAASFKAA